MRSTASWTEIAQPLKLMLLIRILPELLMDFGEIRKVSIVDCHF
jgi:hypothetical protein